MVPENRYLVMSNKDIDAYLTQQQKMNLEMIVNSIISGRESDGKSTDKQFVVISSEWPMYNATWQLLADYVDNQEKQKADTDAIQTNP